MCPEKCVSVKRTNQISTKTAPKHSLQCEKTAACVYSSKASSGPFEKDFTGSLTARLLNAVGRGTTVSPLQGRGQVAH